MLPCDFRTHSECSCLPTECKVQRIPATTKPRPSPHNTTGLQYAAVFMFAALSIAYAATHGASEQQRIDRVNQEIVSR